MKVKSIYNIVSFFLRHPKPIYVHYGVTHRCNLDCKMCDVKSTTEEIEIPQIKKLAFALSEMGIFYVSLGGGEPLIKQNIFKIIEVFRKVGIRVRILTNGILLNKEIITVLNKLNISGISVSLDTLKKEKYKFITGTDNLDGVLSGIELVSKNLRKNKVDIINIVVSKLNYMELPELAKFAKEKGFKLSLIPIENPLEEFMFQNEDFEKLNEIYNYLLRNRKIIFNSSEFLHNSLSYLKGKDFDSKCFAGKLYFSISPEGKISKCHKYSDVAYDENEKCRGCMRPCWREIDFLYKNPTRVVRKLSFF